LTIFGSINAALLSRRCFFNFFFNYLNCSKPLTSKKEKHLLSIGQFNGRRPNTFHNFIDLEFKNLVEFNVVKVHHYLLHQSDLNTLDIITTHIYGHLNAPISTFTNTLLRWIC